MNTSLILPNLRAGSSCFWGVWRLFARLQVCRSVPQSGLNASATHMRLHLPLSGFVPPHVPGFVPPHLSGFVPPHVSAFVPPHVSAFVPPRFSDFVGAHFSAFVGAHVLILPNLRAGGSCFWGVWRLFARLQVCRRVPQMLFATFFSLFFRKVISLPYSFSGFFLGRPLLVSFFSIVCLFSIL